MKKRLLFLAATLLTVFNLKCGSVVLAWNQHPDEIGLTNGAQIVSNYRVYWAQQSRTNPASPVVRDYPFYKDVSLGLGETNAIKALFPNSTNCLDCVTNPCALVTNLPYGSNFFAVTATTPYGVSSDYSFEVWTVVRPGAPVVLLVPPAVEAPYPSSWPPRSLSPTGGRSSAEAPADPP